MKGLLNHTRTDIRQYRAVIGIWLILLAADAVMSCTTLVSSTLATFTSIGLASLVAGLGLAFGLSTPVAMGDHFLATRPVSPRQLWGSKALTLGLVILLPLVLQAIVVSGGLGMGIGHAKMLSAERLLLAVPVVSIMVCLGALEPFRSGFSALLGPSLGLLLAAAGLGACYLGTLEPNGTSVLYWLYTMAAALLVLLWRQVGRPRSMGRNLAIYAAGVMGLVLLQSRGPADLFPLVPPPEIKIPALSVAMGDVSLVAYNADEEMVYVTPKVEGLPEAWWTVPIATAGRFGSTTFTPDPQRAARVRDRISPPLPGKAGEQVLARLCDVDILFKDMNSSLPAAHTRWPRNTFDHQADLEVDLDLALFAYEAIAPPTQVRIGEKPQHPFTFWGELRTPQFLFSRDRATRKQNARKLLRSFAFVLVHKPSRRGVLCDVYPSGGTRSRLSGLPQLNLAISNRAREFWPAWQLDEVELRVFRCVHKGRISATVREPSFAIEAHPATLDRDSIDLREHDRLLPGVAEGDIAALLELISKTPHHFSLWERAPQRLRAMGEDDFTALLSHWNRYSGSGQQVLGMVIEDLLDDAHKAELLAALPAHSDLAYLAVARGWGTDVREPLLAALASRRPATFRMFQALLLLDDPSVHPAILAKFEESPSLQLFNLLEQVPALRPGLDRIARQFWQRNRSVVGTKNLLRDEPFQLGLRSGDPDALALMRECLATEKARVEYGRDLVDALRPILLLPRSRKLAIDALAEGTFRYDPERRFYLETTP